MNAWGQLATLPTAAATPAAIRPTPKVPGQSLGPLAGGSAVPRLTGGIREDTLEPKTPTGGAPAAGIVPNPTPRSTRTEVSRRPRLIPDIPEGVSNFAEDVATGLATDASTSPPAIAFGRGMFGAMKSERDRSEAERTAALDAEKLAYERGRDVASDAREDRRLAIDEATFEEQKKSGYWDKTKSDPLKYIMPDGSDLTPEGELEAIGIANDWAKAEMDILASANTSLRGDKLADAILAVQERRDAYYQEIRKQMLDGKLPLSVPPPPSPSKEAGAPRLVPDDEYSEDKSGLGNQSTKGDALTDTRPRETPKPGGVAVKPASLQGNGTEAMPYTNGSDDPPENLRRGEYFQDTQGNIYVGE